MTYNSAYTGPQIDAAARQASITFDDIADMLADARDYTAHTAGDVFWTAAEGFRYEVAASDATDHHLTTAGVVKLYVLPSDDGIYNFKAFNPAADGVTDDYPALEKALAVPVNPDDALAGPSVFFPPATYLLGSPVELTRAVSLLGPGTGATATKSILLFDTDVRGITINRSDTFAGELIPGAPNSSAADGTLIDGLVIKSKGGTTDPEVNGIWFRARATLKNSVVIGFPGNGIHIVAAFDDSDPMRRGNANCFRIENCFSAQNAINGLYVDGPDTNAGFVFGLDASNNGRWGIYDSSFLGNVYVGCHAEFNGGLNRGNNGSTKSSVVAYEGWQYVARYEATEAELVATTPGTDATVWEPYTEGGPYFFAPTWLPAQAEGTYFTAGNFRTEGAVNYSLIIGSYSEPPCPIVIEGPSAVQGGHMLYFQKGGSFRYLEGNRVSGRSFSTLSDNVTATLGEGGNSALAFINRDDPVPGHLWRLEYQNGDWLMRQANLNTAFRLTSKATTYAFGTGAPIPYVFQADRIGLGSGTNARRQTTSSAAPTTGTWARGDIVWNINASAGGFAGWICTTAGTPGTWKQFGAIEA